MDDFGLGIFGLNTWVCARADPNPDLRLSVAAQIVRCCAWVDDWCGLTIGVGILVASMGARWADEPLCHMHPVGTHFLWHILNAVMLAWMIEVYHRHMLAGKRAKR